MSGALWSLVAVLVFVLWPIVAQWRAIWLEVRHARGRA